VLDESDQWLHQTEQFLKWEQIRPYVIFQFVYFLHELVNLAVFCTRLQVTSNRHRMTPFSLKTSAFTQKCTTAEKNWPWITVSSSSSGMNPDILINQRGQEAFLDTIINEWILRTQRTQGTCLFVRLFVRWSSRPSMSFQWSPKMSEWLRAVCGSVAQWLGRWTCDWKVADSNPSCCTVEFDLGQVVHTHRPATLVLQPHGAI